MFFSHPFAALVTFAALANAAPVVEKRAITDAEILNYALTLEHLENNFYREGLAQFSKKQFAAAGFDSVFYDNIVKVAADEAAHVGFLTEALKAAGATPVSECQYKFGVTDVQSFIATASILEGVGVSAYLGAAADIMNKAYLTAAGSILTVEARHSSYIRAGLKQVPFAQPFDAPLNYNEVYSLASQFIASCPKENPALPVKAFPMLALSSSTQNPIKTGDTIVLQTDAPVGGGEGAFVAFIAVTGPVFVAATPDNRGLCVKVPAGFAGQTYAVLTKSRDSVSDDTVLAGPAILELDAGSIYSGLAMNYRGIREERIARAPMQVIHQEDSAWIAV